MNIVHLSKKVSKLVTFIVVIILISSISAVSEQDSDIIILGKWSEGKIDRVIQSKPQTRPAQIDYISGQFLGTPYQPNTLTGDINTPEVFTVNLKGVDCFTYIDYVEAMRLSSIGEEFEFNLKDLRYKDGNVSFQNRNHFFTDWSTTNKKNIYDVTYEIGGENAVPVNKSLNLKDDGTTFLPGVPVVPRTFYYIPSSDVNEEIVEKLQTGDYVGMYTEIDGLDVTHTGIIIKNDKGVLLRHASSKKSNMRVVDEDFTEYIKNVPGIVVYRPK